MEVEAVPAANRFPKALQRITEVALAVTMQADADLTV